MVLSTAASGRRIISVYLYHCTVGPAPQRGPGQQPPLHWLPSPTNGLPIHLNLQPMPWWSLALAAWGMLVAFGLKGMHSWTQEAPLFMIRLLAVAQQRAGRVKRFSLYTCS